MTIEDGRTPVVESLFMFSPPPAVASSMGNLKTPCEVEADDKSFSSLGVFAAAAADGDVLLAASRHREALKKQELLFEDRLLQKERDIQTKEREVAEVRAKLGAAVEAQSQMRQIVGEYEKTISQLIAGKEREKANMETNLQATIRERDQAIEDLKVR